jgi:hypothetical protein
MVFVVYEFISNVLDSSWITALFSVEEIAGFFRSLYRRESERDRLSEKS